MQSAVGCLRRESYQARIEFLDQNVGVVVYAEGLLAIREMAAPTGESMVINFRSRFAPYDSI